MEIVSLDAATALEPPDHREAREQQRAEIGHAGHREAGSLHDAPESTGGVAPPMAERAVVCAPEPRERRHGNDERATRGERAAGRGQGGWLVVQVLEHVEEKNDVGPSFGHDEIVRYRAGADVEAIGE